MTDEKNKTNEVPVPDAAAEEGMRGRPGKRSVEEKRQAVLDVLSGKATVAQVAKRLCVLPETVEGWRSDAIASMEAAFRQAPGATEEDRKLAAENAQLKRVVVKLEMQKELLENALETERNKRPTRPGRS
ncbi:MAG: transposase [Myxococcales bacterium]|nr:transposase [Myxococcales bacterium]